jgi:hypothetical protein
MGEEKRQTPQEQVRALYDESEKRAAGAMEQLVARDSFGELLARVTENAMAVTKIGFDAMDLVVRNLRLAGRNDVTRLGRQIARTEDKLELVLQEVERLREERAEKPAKSSSSGRSSSSRKSSNGGRRAAKGSRSGTK